MSKKSLDITEEKKQIGANLNLTLKSLRELKKQIRNQTNAMMKDIDFNIKIVQKQRENLKKKR